MLFRSFEYETGAEKFFDETSALFENYLKSESILGRYRILFGLFFLWQTTHKQYDSLVFSLVSEAAFKNGLVDKYEFYQNLEKRTKGVGFELSGKSMDYLPEIVKREQSKGNKVGLKFGHYRRLTVPQLFEINLANEYCDFLIMAIESSDRTKSLKTDLIELTDKQRLNIFTSAGVANVTFLIDSPDLSNEPYRQIVRDIQPDIVYASQGWPDFLIKEYRERAESVNALLITLPEFGDFHTSQIEDIIFNT